MEVTPEISGAFAPGPEKIRSVRLTYRNGGEVNGTIRRLRLSPFKLVLQKIDPAAGERARHKAVFDHVTVLEIIYTDGLVKKFP